MPSKYFGRGDVFAAVESRSAPYHKEWGAASGGLTAPAGYDPRSMVGVIGSDLVGFVSRTLILDCIDDCFQQLNRTYQTRTVVSYGAGQLTTGHGTFLRVRRWSREQDLT